MDADRFDALARALTTRRSRRTTLGTLLGGALPGASLETLAERHKSEVTAASRVCRPAGTACKHGRQCCTKKCLSSGKCSCNADDPCPRPANPCKKAVCSSGRCIIRNNACQSEGKVCCDKACVDTQNDPNHCGTCGNTCLTREVCTQGGCLCESGKEVCGAACVSSCCNQGVEEDCAGGQTCCSGHGCRDLQTDKDHCGECGASCVPDTFTDCVLGECKCGNDPACTGGKICDLDKGGCVCPNGETTCEDNCEGDKVWCGDQCLVCPPPPPGIGLPGDPPPGTCCGELSECSCGGGCCKSKDDCFQTFDSSTNEVVNEFCCTEEGGTVCGDQCCKTSDCASGCVRLLPVGGSYRRPGR
jgi:hypothetical protein